MPRGRNARRLAGSAGLLGAAAAVAAHTAWAGFSGSKTVSQGAIGAGDLYLTVPSYPHAPGSSGTAVANRLQLAVDDLSPNVLAHRVIDITNGGNLDLASVKMSVTVNSSSSPNGTNIATDAQGVRVWVQKCSTDYTEGGSSPDYTETCGGSATDLLGANAGNHWDTMHDFAQSGTGCLVADGGCTLSGLAPAHASVTHLRISFKLSNSSPTTAQGSSFNVTITFDGSQIAGQSK